MNNKIINSYVNNFCIQKKFNKDKFLIFATYQICKKYNLDSNMLIDSIIEGGGDGGVDSIVILIDKKYIYTSEEFKKYSNNIHENSKIEIYFIQAKETNGIKETAFMKIKDMLGCLLLKETTLNLRKQYNDSLIKKIQLINNIIIDAAPKTNNIYFYIYYAYTGQAERDSISIGTKNQIDSISEIIHERVFINRNNIITHICDSTNLITKANTNTEKDYIVKYNEIIKMKYDSEIENGFAVITSIKDYYNLITKDDEIIEELFEGNIRDFAGEDANINKDIRNTLENIHDIDFWWLNNGITIIVKSYSPLPNDSAKLLNPIIVNGLQTSYSIYNYFKKNKKRLESENRNILLKIINIENINISNMIIYASNNQNVVNLAQLKSNDLIQKNIEQIFLQNNIYYERKKNYYKDKKVDKNKIISIQNLAQYMEAIYFGNCKKAKENSNALLQNREYYKLFHKSIEPNIYVITAKIALKVLEELEKITKENKDIFYKKYKVESKIFSLHIMRIVTLILCENNIKENYTTINLNLLDSDLVFNAVIYLEKLISKKAKSKEDIKKMPKSKELNDKLLNINISEVITNKINN